MRRRFVSQRAEGEDCDHTNMELSHALDMESSGIAEDDYEWARARRGSRGDHPSIIHVGNSDFAKDKHKIFRRAPWEELMRNSP